MLNFKLEVQQYIYSSIDFPIEVNCFKLIVETNYANTDVKGHAYVCNLLHLPKYMFVSVSGCANLRKHFAYFSVRY